MGLSGAATSAFYRVPQISATQGTGLYHHFIVLATELFQRGTSQKRQRTHGELSVV